MNSGNTRGMTAREEPDRGSVADKASDTWSNEPAATINARSSEGVIGVNVSGAPSNYQSNVISLSPQLNSTCP